MDKLRKLKNRLSMSVDKLSVPRHSSPKSHQRKSMPMSNVPFSESDIPATLRLEDSPERATSATELTLATRPRPRPSSYCETDTLDSACFEWMEPSNNASSLEVIDTVCDVDTTLEPESQDVTMEESKSEQEEEKEQHLPLIKGDNEVDKARSLSPELNRNELKRSPTELGGESLMAEVMKEVYKITEVSDDKQTKRLKKDNTNNVEAAVEVNDKIPLLNEASTDKKISRDISILSTSDETLLSSTGDSTHEISKVVRRKAVASTSTTLSIASTCRAESLTSGYFSDSDVTLPEKCESNDPKSAFTSLSSENIEKRRSAFIPVSPEHKDANVFGFPSVSAEETDQKNKRASMPLSSELVLKASSIPSKIELNISEVSSKSHHNTTANDPPVIQESKTSSISKRESIYSKIVKKKDSLKEPIYAKVKPKLTIETSFQPIEPSVYKDLSPGVLKPEPKYTVVKPRDPGAPVLPSSPKSPTSPFCPLSPGSVEYPLSPSSVASSDVPDSPISPHTKFGTVGPFSSFRNEPDYYQDKSVDKCNTLPKEPIYSKVRKNITSKGLKESIYSKVKPKEPIYTKPLPLTPREEAMLKRESFITGSPPSSVDYYGKVTVRATEISQVSPSRPAVITINNPGYAAPKGIDATSTTSETTKIYSSSVTTTSSASTVKTVDKLESAPPVISPLESSVSRTLVASESSLIESSDTESTGRAKLSALVEELANELEAVSRRIGSNTASTEESKKEVLTKLLSTYDIPKNLRRVEEADENAVIEAEKSLVPTSISIDELRYVDDNEDNAETIYADIPDYSQDEFVIALDDENDPKYASLTRDFRQQKIRETDSPGRVSRRTANVYANAINIVSALKVLLNSKSTKAASVINKMGSLARPYTGAPKVQGPISDTTWIQRVIYHKTGHNGFDELRKYIKSGGEFCKELSTIMHERAELEANYAKGLLKLSAKLLKASKESMGTVNQAWQMIGGELEQEGDLHKTIAASITDDVVRPLRQLIETQHKIRKGVESMVDKTTKNLHDWRALEGKSKKQCFGNNRENEKIQDMMIEARLGRGKTLSDKETIKVEKQKRKAEEGVQKTDLEYYTCCVRAERARLEWESAIYKGSNCFQTLEEERLQALKDLIVKYHQNTKEAAPKMVAIASRLDDPVSACDVEKDIQTVISAKGTGENIPEQMLPDFYAEDMNNIMNRERRREALEKFMNMLKTDLERERRGKQGVENLAKALQETPNFGGEESQQDVNDKLMHMKAMLAYLEAARYKVQCSLDDINNKPKMTHPLAKHIEVHRDKQGFTFSVLKVPPWVRSNSVDVSPASDSPVGSPNWNDRGTADGNSVQPDSDFGNKLEVLVDLNDNSTPVTKSHEGSPFPPNRSKSSTIERDKMKRDSKVTFQKSETLPKPSKLPSVFMSAPRYPSLMVVTDEFSSQGSDREYQTAVTAEDSTDAAKEGTYYTQPLQAGPVVGRCKALYDYEANMYDELTIRTGDIINITEKQPDGWWVGELNNVVGIFPATYVEEID